MLNTRVELSSLEPKAAEVRLATANGLDEHRRVRWLIDATGARRALLRAAGVRLESSDDPLLSGTGAEWLLQGDDDTTFSLGQVSERLSNPHLPLLVGQRGPRRGAAMPGCYKSDERSSPKIDCCSTLDTACPVELGRPVHYEARSGKLVQDGVCAGGHLHHECCAIRPSPTRLRVDAGYPYTLDLSPNANATTSVARSWVYGGAGYAVSRGLMNVVQRPKWKRCVDQAICGNADQRVTRCVLNLGWALSLIHI